MPARPKLALFSVLAAVTLAIGLVLARGPARRASLAAGRGAGAAGPGQVQPDAAPGSTPVPAAAPPEPATSGPLRYLGVGGGPLPENTEVSLEQNLALARSVLEGPGALLFAGGPGSRSVRVLAADAPTDTLLQRLGDLFQPRAARDSRFRPSELGEQGPATPAEVEARLVQALAAPSPPPTPLLLYFATHGEQGELARDNAVLLWGGTGLSAARLAELHDAHPRPLRVVNASCFSGGFAELAFDAADAERGPARAPRCGLFAGTWDRETSGCDPDPDRRRQEGYSLHFFQALRGLSRDGEPLAVREVDFDGDGQISLLEAHTRASIAGLSIDVPVTTSERYLRSVQHTRGAPDAALLPEVQALVEQLSAQLGLADERAALERKRAVDAQLDELDQRYDAAESGANALHAELSARLLGQFPVLDDPYHPEFAALLAEERVAIEQALERWPEARRYAHARRELEALDARYLELDVEEARLTRLALARETLSLSAGLARRGGAALRHYQALLACERFVPGLTAGARAGRPPRDARAEPRYR